MPESISQIYIATYDEVACLRRTDKLSEVFAADSLMFVLDHSLFVDNGRLADNIKSWRSLPISEDGFLFLVSVFDLDELRIEVAKLVEGHFKLGCEVLQLADNFQLNVAQCAPVFGYEWAELSPGVPYTAGLRQLYRMELDNELCAVKPPNPFRFESTQNFLEWICDVAPDSTTGIPRYAEAIYLDSLNAKLTFPRVRQGEVTGYGRWLQHQGYFKNRLAQVAHAWMKSYRSKIVDDSRDDSVGVVGFFQAEHGIGQAARLLVEGLRAVGVSIVTSNVYDTASRQSHNFQVDEKIGSEILILCLNPEHLDGLFNHYGEDFFQSRYVIGLWFWELESAPSWYENAYKYVDELWAPTRFIHSMLQKSVPDRVAVNYYPIPLEFDQFSELSPADELADELQHFLKNKYSFLFTFDYLSVIKRKNPIGVIRAFKKAFKVDDNAVLVLKSINGDLRPRERARIIKEIKNDKRILCLDGYLSQQKIRQLMELCDCYVSLHRAEGLGLTMAEAMLLGKPVIATSYSGNMEFMTQENSFLVSWRPIKVGRNAGSYDKKAIWAEPNILCASDHMRELYENPRVGVLRGSEAKRDLDRRFNLAEIGKKLQFRLEEIRKSRS